MLKKMELVTLFDIVAQSLICRLLAYESYLFFLTSLFSVLTNSGGLKCFTLGDPGVKMRPKALNLQKSGAGIMNFAMGRPFFH